LEKLSNTAGRAYDRSVLWLEAIGCDRHGTAVLDNVTFWVSGAELVVVEGSQASGKSTLLEVAAGARYPDRGAVWFAGRNTTTLQRASMPFVRRNIGFYTAEALLVDEDTVLANVMAALAIRGEPFAAAEATARDALALVRAHELADRKVGSLSTGQRRIVALARALAGPQPLVVADEPAALLVDEARALVIAALVTAREAGAAVLTATADAALANVLVTAGGRRIHLTEGRIVGAPAVGLVPDLPEPQSERSRQLAVEDQTPAALAPGGGSPR
jgi:ABC-type ATPase involved in cell division